MSQEEVRPSELLRTLRPALVIVDEQRRHLDPDIAYHPVIPASQAHQVVAHTARALKAARACGLPVVHVLTYSRLPVGGKLLDNQNPFWNRQGWIPGSTVRRQVSLNIEGSPYAEIMSEVAPISGEPCVVKRRYSGFYQTDLELVLRGAGANAVVLAGVNTNNCVMGTAFDAHARDFFVFVLSDACGSMNGPDFHEWGLRQIQAALGWVLTVDEFEQVCADVETTRHENVQELRKGS
jgi:nicotinamidase-related amidase